MMDATSRALLFYTLEMEDCYMMLLMLMSALDYTEILLDGVRLAGFLLTPS